VVVVAVLVSACGGDASDPATDGAGVATSASAVLDWDEPAMYEYELQSDCGERTLIGSYRITVTDGEVTDVVAGDDAAAVVVADPVARTAVLTLGELLREAREAEASGADLVDIETDGGADGRPVRIEIDYDRDATDDEACYRVTAFENLTASATEAAPPVQLPPRSTWPLTVRDPRCEADSSCAEGFVIGEVFYLSGCTPVRDESVSDEAIAGGPDAVHVIEGVDPLALVAQRRPACDEAEDAPDARGWYLAIGPTGPDQAVICRVSVLTDRQKRTNGC